jgi:hypothetical protein
MSEQSKPDQHDAPANKKDTADPKVEELSDIEMEEVAGGMAAPTFTVSGTWSAS